MIRAKRRYDFSRTSDATVFEVLACRNISLPLNASFDGDFRRAWRNRRVNILTSPRHYNLYPFPQVPLNTALSTSIDPEFFSTEWKALCGFSATFCPHLRSTLDHHCLASTTLSLLVSLLFCALVVRPEPRSVLTPRFRPEPYSVLAPPFTFASALLV